MYFIFGQYFMEIKSVFSLINFWVNIQPQKREVQILKGRSSRLALISS